MPAPLLAASPLVEAFHFAADRHRDQRRHDAVDSPYINHPIDVVWWLARAGVEDRDTLIAAVLHDTLEDTATRPDEIERRFGPVVRRLVEEVTDPPGLKGAARRRRQLEGVAGLSPAARLIRQADKIASLGRLRVDWSRAERRAYLAWVRQMGEALKGLSAQLDRSFAHALAEAESRPFPEAPPSGRAKSAAAAHEANRRRHARFRQARGILDDFDLAFDMLYSEEVGTAAAAPGKPPIIRVTSNPVLLEEARRGADCLRLVKRPDRRVDGWLDGQAFNTSRDGGELLSVLMGRPREADGMPGRCAPAELTKQMSNRLGREYTAGALAAQVRRLRQELRRAGINPLFLFTTQPDRKYRLLVRHVSPADDA